MVRSNALARVSVVFGAFALPMAVLIYFHVFSGTGSTLEIAIIGALALLGCAVAGTITYTDANRMNAHEWKLDGAQRVIGVIELKPDGTILSIGSKAMKTMGSRADRCIGHHHSVLLDPVMTQRTEYRELWNKLSRGEYVELAQKYPTEDGGEVIYQTSYTPVFSRDGKVEKIISWLAPNSTQPTGISASTDLVANALKKLAAGDLTIRLDTDSSKQLAAIASDFNAAADHLQQSFQAVVTDANAINSGAEEISQAADNLSRRTEQQAASLEQTAAALEEITATVRKTAANARDAHIGVRDAKSAAEEGGRVVETAINAMDSIAQSSRKIADIIGVIDEIAFQTNLLALNAGVEAARAGDAGRGFAVVASEVRALAQRSGDAAKEIKALINTSGEHVSSGVNLVAETGKALSHIVEQVTQINGLIGEMAQAAEQQSTGIEQVNAAVGQMDQVTQQNAAMVEESNAASRQLAGEAQSLVSRVGYFNLGSPNRALSTPQKPTDAPATIIPLRKAMSRN